MKTKPSKPMNGLLIIVLCFGSAIVGQGIAAIIGALALVFPPIFLFILYKQYQAEKEKSDHTKKQYLQTCAFLIIMFIASIFHLTIQ